MIIHREITALLWRIFYFRLAVIWYAHRSLPGGEWLAFETPMMLSLKQTFLDSGDLAGAAQCQRAMDEWDARR